MFFTIEEIYQFKNIVLIGISMSIDVLKQFYLIQRLIEEIFAILYHLKKKRRRKEEKIGKYEEKIKERKGERQIVERKESKKIKRMKGR